MSSAGKKKKTPVVIPNHKTSKMVLNFDYKKTEEIAFMADI